MSDLIVCLPGDGIGPEVLEQARARARSSCRSTSSSCELPFGGAAIDEFGEPAARGDARCVPRRRAVLLGAVGGPQWDGGAGPARSRA